MYRGGQIWRRVSLAVIGVVALLGCVSTSVKGDPSPSLNAEPAVFVPTTEWQEFGKDQALPPGLDVTIDLQTGVRQARLPPAAPTSGATSTTSAHKQVMLSEPVVQAPDAPTPTASLKERAEKVLAEAANRFDGTPQSLLTSMVQLSEIGRIQNEKGPKDASDSPSPSPPQYRTPEELRELGDWLERHMGKTDAVLMKEKLKLLDPSRLGPCEANEDQGSSSSSSSTGECWRVPSDEQIVSTLIDLRELVANIDNAVDFAAMGGLPILMWWMRCPRGDLAASSMQASGAAAAAAVPAICDTIGEESEAHLNIRAHAVGVIGSLIQNNPKMQALFHQRAGVRELGRLLRFAQADLDSILVSAGAVRPADLPPQAEDDLSSYWPAFKRASGVHHLCWSLMFTLGNALRSHAPAQLEFAKDDGLVLLYRVLNTLPADVRSHGYQLRGALRSADLKLTRKALSVLHDVLTDAAVNQQAEPLVITDSFTVVNGTMGGDTKANATTRAENTGANTLVSETAPTVLSDTLLIVNGTLGGDTKANATTRSESPMAASPGVDAAVPVPPTADGAQQTSAAVAASSNELIRLLKERRSWHVHDEEGSHWCDLLLGRFFDAKVNPAVWYDNDILLEQALQTAHMAFRSGVCRFPRKDTDGSDAIVLTETNGPMSTALVQQWRHHLSALWAVNQPGCLSESGGEPEMSAIADIVFQLQAELREASLHM